MKQFLAALILLSLLLAPYSSAVAGIDEGVAAYNRGDFSTSIKELRPLLKNGDAGAKAIIWLMYLNPEGMSKSEALAYREAAFKLGPWVTEKGTVEAVKWYQNAANQGIAGAQFMLGFAYNKGNGIQQDFSKALYWYRKSADQGFSRAQLKLGTIYGDGLGVPKNNIEAVKWLRKSAEQELPEAQYLLSIMYGLGRGVPKDYPIAIKFLRKSAAQGYSSAQLQLGHIYRYGQGVQPDHPEALKWYRLAADQGEAKAQHIIGMMYLFLSVPKDGGLFPDPKDTRIFQVPDGVTENSTKAMPWFLKAAEQGYTISQRWLAGMYTFGRGAPRDHVQSFKWKRRAAEKGNAQDQYFLGSAYSSGRGTAQDYDEAMKWYLKAAMRGDTGAKHSIGDMYKNGEGVLQDFITAHMWYNLAGTVAGDDRDKLEPRMTPADISKAQRLAREWEEKHSN